MIALLGCGCCGPLPRALLAQPADLPPASSAPGSRARTRVVIMEDPQATRAFKGEPFLVPLAIPFIAGPSAIATVLLLVSREPHRIWEWLGALSVAMAISAVVLGFAEKIADFLGEQVTLAFERLMGLVLTAIAIEMLLAGIEKFVLQIRAA